MGVKQDAWNAEIAAFDAARAAHESARDHLLSEWVDFMTYLDDFLNGEPTTQTEWDAWVLRLRRATITKGPRLVDGVVVRAAETQDSYVSTLAPLTGRIDNLRVLAAGYAEDPTISRNTQNQIGRIDFTQGVQYSPASGTYRTKKLTGEFVEITVRAPHWWLVPNQYSGLILRGRGEELVSVDPENARGKLGGLPTPSVNDSGLWALRDDCAAVTDID